MRDLRSDLRRPTIGAAIFMASIILPAALSDCSFQVAGTAVEIAFESSALPGRFDQTTVDFEQATVAFDEVELVPCDSEPLSRVWRQLLAKTALAHGVTTPTQLGVSVVLDATRPTSIAGGLLEPPAGHYCAVRIRVAPSDDDALGARADAGRSLVVKGTTTSTEPHETLLWHSSSRSDRAIPLESPLVLDPRHLSHRVVVVLAPERWFTSDDLRGNGPELSASDLLERALGSISVRHEAREP